MIHQWRRALLEGASGVFDRGGRKRPESDEEPVNGRHIHKFVPPEITTMDQASQFTSFA